MKILHVNTNDTGGAAIAAIRLHLLLLDKGIDSRILFLKRSGKVNIREAYYFEDAFRYKPVFKFLLALNSIYNRRFTFYKPDIYFNGPDSLFDISKHELFAWADVIHLHWVIKFLDWRKVFRHRKRFAWTFHDMNPFTGGEHYQTGYNQEFSWQADRNLRKKTRLLKDTDMTIISPSGWLGHLAQNSRVFAGKPVIIIRNPVNTDIFNIRPSEGVRERLHIPSHKKILLFVAENPEDERKGFNLLMKAIVKLPDKDHLHLLVIGKATHIQVSGLSCTLAGSIHDEQVMAEIYNVADLFIIPSIEDNLPNTVSESLLCGTPVAGFCVGGIGEMIKNDANGYLAKSPDELDIAIQKAMARPYDQNGIRAEALQELDNGTIFRKLNEVYGR